jgi:hypothetical protein
VNLIFSWPDIGVDRPITLAAIARTLYHRLAPRAGGSPVLLPVAGDAPGGLGSWMEFVGLSGVRTEEVGPLFLSILEITSALFGRLGLPDL